MNHSNISRLKQIMNAVRMGRGLGTPQSSPALFQHLGMFATGLNKLSMLMQQYSIDNNISGMSDPESYNKAMFAAQLGLKLGNVGGARLVRKFVEDHYRYVVHPAIRSIGKAGGRYGEILENYMQAKSDIKKSWGDIGAQIGSTIALGIGNFTKGLRTLSLAAGGTGIGIPAALAGLAVSFVVQGIASMVLPWIGRKIGEAIAVGSGYIDKYSDNVLGGGVLKIVPQNAQHFQSVANSVVGQKWYDNTFNSYMSRMEQITYTPRGGFSLHDLGMSIQDTGSVYDSIGKTMKVDPSYRGYYTQKLAGIKGITDVDVSDTFAGISQGSALSKTSVSSNEIDKTADAFAVFLDAISKGSKATSKSALGLTKALAASADIYSKRNINVKNVDVMFSGVQQFVQKNMQATGKQDTTEASDVIGILNGIAKSAGNSPLATQISRYAGLNFTQAQRGLDAEGFENMSHSLSALYNFGGDSSVDKKTGALKLGRRGENAWAKLYLDSTAPREKGGLGLTDDQAQELIKYVVAFQTNTADLKFGGAVTSPLEEAGRAVKLDTTFKILQKEVQISDTYQKLATTFTGDFISLGDSVERAAMATTEKIASGAINLLDIALGLTKGGGATEGTSYIPSTSYTAPTRQAGTGVIEEKDMLIAQKGFKESIMSAASKAGLELKTLYAFLGAESRFGANTQNYAGMDYVGIGQIGAEAQTHMNREHGTNLDRFKDSDNVQLAAFYADYLRDRYVKMKSGEFKGMNFDPNDPRVIYMAYNWGMGNLDKHIRKYGGINWEALPKETKIGVGNVEKALRGYDAVQGVSARTQSTDARAVGNLTVLDTDYEGGVIRGAWAQSRRSGEALLYRMSGKGSTTGNRIASEAEKLLAARGNYGRFSSNYDFYGMCATVAGWAIEAGGYGKRAKGDADVQRDLWAARGMTLTLDEIARTGGFQPGDIIYYKSGVHVGIVAADGSIIQGGFAQDEKGSELVRTDATTFGRAGNNAVVVRVSADANLDGVLSPSEKNQIFSAVTTTSSVVTKLKTVRKTVKGSKVLVNALVEDTKGTFSVKSARGTGLSKEQVARIKAKEAVIEKMLGLSSDQLNLETKSVAGGTMLNVKINAPMGNVGKIAQDLIREIERLL